MKAGARASRMRLVYLTGRFYVITLPVGPLRVIQTHSKRILEHSHGDSGGLSFDELPP